MNNLNAEPAISGSISQKFHTYGIVVKFYILFICDITKIKFVAIPKRHNTCLVLYKLLKNSPKEKQDIWVHLFWAFLRM